jgi:hypothetical protein
MNFKKVCVAALAVFAAYFAMEFLVHGVWLKEIYRQTASLWRPEEEMKKLFLLMTLGQFLFAKFFTVIFSKGYETGKNGLGQGLRFGFWVGLMLAPMTSLVWYAILPIPAILAVYWLAAGFVEMVVLGLVAGAVYRP